MFPRTWLHSTDRPAWLGTALACAAMLVLPLLAWWFVPSAAPPGPRVPSAAVAVEPPTVEEARPTSPAARRLDPAPAAFDPAEEPEDDDEPRGDAVKGLVLDGSGQPVGGAHVGCEGREERALRTRTSVDGQFSLGADADGCDALAHHAEHGPPSERVRLAAGKENVIRLAAPGGIAGLTVDERGLPVPGYLLAIESYEPPGPTVGGQVPSPPRRPRTIDDPGGTFLWERLAPGRYVLTASADGRPPARSGSVEVESGRTAQGVRIVLTRGALLTGVVIDLDKKSPLEGARVTLDAVTSSTANAIGAVTSDAAGAFTLDGVPTDGPFSIRVVKPGFRTKIIPGLTASGGDTSVGTVELQTSGDAGADGTELVGIGAVLVPTGPGLFIAGTIPGGPAAKAGVKSGDRLVTIDGAPASGLDLVGSIQRLRGAEGTTVQIGILVGGTGGAPRQVNLVREVVVQ